MILAVACALSGALPAGVVSAQDKYPDKPVRIIVPTPPGGSSDSIARILGEALQLKLKQSFIVENKVGASGTIGAAYAAKAPADGYTILLGTGSTHVVAPLMMKDIAYDPIKDFSPLAVIGKAPFVFFVNSALPIRSLQELADYAKKRSTPMTIGTSGIATIYEVGALMLEQQANIKLNHIPYSGLAPLALGVSGGDVDIGLGPIDGYLKTDKLRVLVVLGNKRVSSLPDVPSSSESGFPQLDIPVFAAMWGPPGLPPKVLSTLRPALAEVLAQKDVQDKIRQTGVFVEAADGDALETMVRNDLSAVKAVIAATATAK